MLDRTIKPIPTGEIEFNLPEINKFELDNKLKVYFVKKNTLPIIQINFVIPSGSIYDPQNQNGIAKLTSMLLDESAGNLSGLEIADKLETLGAILNINTNKEFTTLSLLTLKENLVKSLEIISLIITSPDFNKTDFERELLRLKNQIIQLNDDPSYIASDEFIKTVYNGTPFEFATNGSLETIKNIAEEKIKSFYSVRYLPNKSYVITVGDTNQDELNKLLNTFFGHWQINEPVIISSTTVKKTSRQIVFIDKPNAAQSELRVGHFSKGRNSDDFYARTVLNSIIGGQFSSRINLNLREDKGYTYGVNSNYSYNSLGSTFTISTSIKTENTIEAVKEILFELENVKSTITEEEITFSKSYLIRRYPSLFETYSQVAANISLLPIFNLQDDYFENYISNLNSVNLREVSKAANDAILLDEMVIIVLGNKSIIKDTLNKFANNIGAKYSEILK
jgi:zinc protease